MLGISLLLFAVSSFIRLSLSDFLNENKNSCTEYQWLNMKVVNCSGRWLTSLPNITSDVKILDLSKNKIRELRELENLTSVHTVILSENNITIIEIPSMPNLKLLDLSSNNFSNVEDISFKDSQIEELRLDFNHVKNLKNTLFEQNPRLKVLRISTNPITVISVLTSKTIEELYLNDIPLTYIKQESLVGLSRLKKLSLVNNKWFYTLNRNGPLILEQLIVLNASNCHITIVDVTRFPKLEILNLSHNDIFKIDEETFKNNSKLYNIDLSNNLINSIEPDSFAATGKLAYLNLAGNKIKNLNWTPNLNNIINLNISHNEITDISNLKLIKVRVLDLSNNKIDTMLHDLNSSLPKITHLNLKRNKIKNINPIKSSSIEELNLSSCKIVHVDEEAFKGLNSLKRLNLSDNKIKRINFAKHLLDLEELNLKENVWDCDCMKKDQIELFGNKNISLLDDVVCEPHGLTWEEFCRRKEEEEKEKKKLLLLQKITVRESTKKGSVDTGWLAGGLVALILILIVSGVIIYRKRKNRRHLRKFEKKDKKPNVDLLEATPQVQQCYQYSFVYPPLEEVELRKTFRESVEPKYIDLQITEETQNFPSQNRNDKE